MLIEDTVITLFPYCSSTCQPKPEVFVLLSYQFLLDPQIVKHEKKQNCVKRSTTHPIQKMLSNITKQLTIKKISEVMIPHSHIHQYTKY